MKSKSDSHKNLLIGKELEEYKNKYLRALADYQNLEKRTKEHNEDERKFAVRDFLMKLMDVVDVLEKAEDELKNEGLSLAVKQLKDLLKKEQVEEIETTGKKFDPLYMDCVESKGGDEVIEQVRKGYKMYGKVIRVARVKVGKFENSIKKSEDDNKN